MANAEQPAKAVAIIGGGLAGLTAAYRLRQYGGPVRVSLFEASDRFGGAIKTVEQAGYVIDRGPDSFLTNKPAAVALCRELDLEADLQPTDTRYRGALVLRDGVPRRVPAGFELMAPARIGPMLRTPILSPLGKLRMLAELLVPARREIEDEALGPFVRRRLGREAFERLVQPLVAGIYTADPEKLSLAATLPRFLEMERDHGGLIRAKWNTRDNGTPSTEATGARYGLFVGLRGGMQLLTEALQHRLADDSRVALRSGTCVTALEKMDRQWHLRFGDDKGQQQTEQYEVVILALPSYVSAKLLRGVDASLADRLAKVEYASSAVIVTGHRLQDVKHPLDAFGLVIPAIERRKILAVSFSSRKFPDRAPEGSVLLRTFVGGATQPDLLQQTDDELVALVRQELADLLGVTGEPEISLVSRYERAMPQYHVGHLDRIREIEIATAAHAGLQLTGSAYRGVGIPDVIADANRAADAVLQI